jgi:exoribonuclease R
VPRRHVRIVAEPGNGAVLRAGFERIRDELSVPDDFPPEVVAEAEDAVRRVLPAEPDASRQDLRDIPFLTIDPTGSTDLDQAMHLERRDGGYRVRYAIADLTPFVAPGGAVDTEAQERGQTLYAPDGRTPLHPEVLSEDAASLLPERERLAFVWTLDLDETGGEVARDVRRAVVRSGARWDYEQAQEAIEGGTLPADSPLMLLRTIGQLRESLEAARGGVNLPLAEQEVVRAGDGYDLEYRFMSPVEGWNAQISLLTGMAAASIMIEGGVGVLRTLPEAPASEVEKLRRTARALGVDWPADMSYGAVLRALDISNPKHGAFAQEAASLLRGAGYVTFDGAAPSPAQAWHAAVAAPYAHVTAPIRRLVDRYGLECCVALCAGDEVPGWVREALPGLPARMAASDRHAGELERAYVELVEAVVLAPHVGSVFDAVVIDLRRDGDGTVQLVSPAVRARCTGAVLPLGERVRVRLTEASVEERRVRFELA